MYQHTQTQLQLQPEEDMHPISAAKIKSGKLVVLASLIKVDSNKQSPNGLIIMTKVLETADCLGYGNCLANKREDISPEV